MRHYLIYLLCLLASSGLLAREYDLQEMIRLAESGNKEIRLAKDIVHAVNYFGMARPLIAQFLPQRSFSRLCQGK